MSGYYPRISPNSGKSNDKEERKMTYIGADGMGLRVNYSGLGFRASDVGVAGGLWA